MVLDSKAALDMTMKTPFACQWIGPSKSGKSTAILKLLQYANEIVDEPFDQITYVYKVYDPRYENFPHVNFVQNYEPYLTSEEYLANKRSLLILDDVIHELCDSIVQLFVCGSHHYNCSIILVQQSLFYKGFKHTASITPTVT